MSDYQVKQNKNTQLFLIGGPYCHGEVPGVQKFSYDPQRKLTRRGTNTFFGDGPVAITDNYEGVTGNFETDGAEGEQTVLAFASRQAVADFVSYHPSNNMPVYIVNKAFEDDGVTPLGCDFIDTAKIGSLKRGVLDGNAVFPFEALNYKEVFGKEIIIEEFPGNATPVVSLATDSDSDNPAVQLEGRGSATYYALAVLKQESGSKIVTRLKKAQTAASGYYSEAVSTGALTITLHADDGLGADEKALVIYARG